MLDSYGFMQVAPQIVRGGYGFGQAHLRVSTRRDYRRPGEDKSPWETDTDSLESICRVTRFGVTSRLETDGNGHLIEVFESQDSPRTIYGHTRSEWSCIRHPHPWTNHRRYARRRHRKADRYVQVLRFLQMGAATRAEVATSLGITLAAAGHYLRDLETAHLLSCAPINTEPNAPFRYWVTEAA
jgi:hypothetical protein